MGKHSKKPSRLSKIPQREPDIQVRLPLSVARDLVTVLAKFSNHKMSLLQMGQKEQATRLLSLNLFRVSVEEKIREMDED